MPIEPIAQIKPIEPIIGPAVDKLLKVFPPTPTPTGGSNEYPNDPADSTYARWFLPKPDVLAGNEVTTYLFASELWIALRQEIDKTYGPTNFIYLIGRDLETDTDMATGAPTPVKHVTLGQLLTDADAHDVQVRVILQTFDSNKPAITFIIGLAKHNGDAVDDFNHQKIVVIANKNAAAKDELVAFCGGIDITTIRSKWHDVHCRIRGPAAAALYDTFVQRWSTHKGAKALLSAPQSKPPGDKYVQVVRTYPKSWILPAEHTIYDLIANAIKTCKNFIYLEDQYFVAESPMKFGGKPISTLLADKLKEPEFKALVILIARTEWINAIGELGGVHQGWRRRRHFIEELNAADASKVAVCTYKASGTKQIGRDYPVHIHSKTWIFDDTFAIFGSANCHRVGYTSGAEADVGIADPNSAGNRPSFAHKLRIDLWLKHLNGAGSSAFKVSHVTDFLKALIYWQRPVPTSSIEPYNVDGDQYLTAPNLAAKDATSPSPYTSWDSAWATGDPDGS